MTKKRKVGRPVEVKDAKRVLIVLSAADVKLLKALSEKEHRSVCGKAGALVSGNPVCKQAYDPQLGAEGDPLL